MRHLQFKFDPVPTKLVGICLFHPRWIKTFDTQLFCQLCIKYGLVFYKNDLVQFCNKYMVGPSQKNLIAGTQKMENEFSVQRKWKITLATLFGIPRCTLVHNMRSFEQTMPWMWPWDWSCGLESHESSRMIAHFWEHFFKIIAILQVYYFSWKLGHI